MKVKINAGAEIDTITRDEMAEVLSQWVAEIKRGVRYIRRPAAGTVDGSGNLQISPPDFGPAGSFTWSVTRISATGMRAGEAVNIYVNNSTPSMFIGTITPTTGLLTFPGPALVLNPLDRLVLAGAGMFVGEQITCNVGAAEVPVQLSWQLVG